MRRAVIALLLSSIASVAAQAQEGYPLDGTWRGEREADKAKAGIVVVVIEWDGTAIGGVMNPGPRGLRIKDVNLDPDGWKVTITGESANGNTVSFHGVLQDIGSYHRYIDGTWTEGGRDYRVRLTRE